MTMSAKQVVLPTKERWALLRNGMISSLFGTTTMLVGSAGSTTLLQIYVRELHSMLPLKDKLFETAAFMPIEGLAVMTTFTGLYFAVKGIRNLLRVESSRNEG